MVMPSGDFERIKPNRRATNEQHFDYRWGAYDEDDWYKDPHDNSLVTFRGHRVLRTLIRCHFSPPGSTNSRYVYSGSEDGKVYIWNMDATLAGTVNVYEATKNSRPRRSHFDMMGWDDEDDGPDARWRTCVRDASWHPNAPMIVGTCTLLSIYTEQWLTVGSICMERIRHVHWNLHSSFVERWCRG
jgi:WD repeat-containing protein 23